MFAPSSDDSKHETVSALALRPGFALLLPLLLVTLAYAESPLGEFVWDDHPLIEEQAFVKELAPVSEYFERMFWSDPLRVSRGFYRPIVTLSYAVEYQIWNGKPWGFHLSNVVLHLSVTALVFLLCRRNGAGPWVAALASSVFGVAPRLSESVAWVSGRTDLLAGLFVLGALLVWTSTSGHGLRRWLAATAILLGLFCKEVAAVALVGIVVYEMCLVGRGRRTFQAASVNLGVLSIPVVIYLGMRLRAAGMDGREMQEFEQVGLPFGQRWEAMLVSVSRYAGMLLDPWHPQTQIGRLGDHPVGLMVVGGLVLLLWGGVAVWVIRVGRPFQVAAFMAASAALVMVVHLVPVAVNVLAADRFLYLPIALGCAGLAGGIEEALKKRPLGRWGMLGLSVFVVSLVVVTRQRVSVWNDEYLVWSEAAQRAQSGEYYTHHQLGTLLMDARLWRSALEHFYRAEAELGVGGSLSVWNNIALCLDRLGRRDESIRLFEQMSDRRDRDQRVRFNLVMVYLRAGRFDDARRELSRLGLRLPDSEIVLGLTRLVDDSQARWEQFPPLSSIEPIELTAERARYFQGIGGSFEAMGAWKRIAFDSGASRELRREAATNLVFDGELEIGRSALHHLRKLGGDATELESLQNELDRRSRLLR